MKNKGFTLIEMVVVIVILGILAVTAAPRFLNIQDDAKASTLAGHIAAFKTGIDIVNAKYMVSGEPDTLALETGNLFFADSGDVKSEYPFPSTALSAPASIEGCENIMNTVVDFSEEITITLDAICIYALDDVHAFSYDWADGSVESI